MSDRFYVGVDVGTGSARVGLFNHEGELVAAASKKIQMWQPKPNFAEQSSTDIWNAICHCMAEVLDKSGVDADAIKGLGFDATCSLVALDENFEPTTISPTGEHAQNIIVWMDHRAIAEAQHIEQMGDPVLRFTGGKMSPEMEIPKLLWLKKNMPEAFHRAAHFFDLPDWLVHRATGSLDRSLCSTGCKWTYDTQNGANGEGWSRNFFQALGLETLLENDAPKIGQTFLSPGVPVSNGLSEKAAKELGLEPGTPVGASLIDAYAGALGTLGVQKDETEQGTRLALISGTSACHIVPSNEPVFVSGVWGPYLAALTPSKWVNEAGQSFAGALIDRIIAGHGANNQLQETAKSEEKSIYDVLHEKLAEQAGTSAQTHLISKGLHIQPDFLGNRSPLADPTRKGAIVGLTPQCDLDDLARQYLATIQALAYGSRQIIEKLNEQGVGITTIVVSGGLAQNELYLREHADATGCTILVPDTKEPVLLGSAMLGAFASGAFARLDDAMTVLSGNATTITPRDANIRAYHDAKYGVFLRMQNDYPAYQALMHEFGE